MFHALLRAAALIDASRGAIAPRWTATTRVCAVSLMTIVAFASARARAQDPAPQTQLGVADAGVAAPEIATGGESLVVGYSRIDRSTVRVFAVRSVRQVDARGRQRWRTIAVPEAGHGSGLLVSEDGLVLTAHHVVAGARYVAVRLAGGGGVYPAVPVFLDEERDIALLAVPGHFDVFTSVTQDAAPPLRVRQTVHAVGYPVDPARSDPQSSRGIVAGAGDDGVLQLDIGVNPGNSGGPLIDEQERVVGMVVARGRIDRGIQNVGFAVPIAPMRAAVESAMAGPLARARRRFDQNPVEWARLATIVDASVRVGALGVIQNIVHAIDHDGMQGLLNTLQQLSTQVSEPDLKVLVSAVFWNASVALLERLGGSALSGYALPAGTQNRETIIRLADRAQQLCLEATTADRAVGTRSLFARSMAANARHRGVRSSGP